MIEIQNFRFNRARHYIFFILLLLQFAAYLGLTIQHLIYGTLTHERIPYTLGWVGLAFVGYIATLWWLEGQKQSFVRWLFVGALLMRGVLLFTVPTLSSDVYRYLWDGYVANQGVSPYAYPIDSPALDWLDAPIRSQANHAWMASPYMPAAQWLFGLVTWGSAWCRCALHPRTMQVTMVLLDMINGLLLVKLLALAHLPCRRAYLYLWNPLVIIEVAQGAHVDTWMITLTLLTLWLVYRSYRKPLGDAPHRPYLSSLAPLTLAFATLTKILPGLLLPVLFWRWRWWQLALYGLTVIGFLAAAGMRAGWGLTGPLDGHGLFAALRIYGDRWNFNSGLFHWLELGLTHGVLAHLDLLTANLWAKRTVLLLLLLVVFGVWITAQRSKMIRTDLRLMALPLMAYILFTTTVHPWYLLFLLAFIPFLTPAEEEGQQLWWLIIPWVYLSAALFLSYVTYINPDDLREYTWVRLAEWIPTFALCVVTAYYTRFGRVAKF